MQYGLAALKSGAITPAQFVALNADIGGIDFTGAEVPQRDRGEPAGAATRSTPTTCTTARPWACAPRRSSTSATTSTSPGFGNDIHTTDWSFVMRARLLAANGTAGNQVIIENQPTAAEVNRGQRLRAARRWTRG